MLTSASGVGEMTWKFQGRWLFFNMFKHVFCTFKLVAPLWYPMISYDILWYPMTMELSKLNIIPLLSSRLWSLQKVLVHNGKRWRECAPASTLGSLGMGCLGRPSGSNPAGWENHDEPMSTLWKTYKKLWKITMFNGKIHYFYGHFQ